MEFDDTYKEELIKIINEANTGNVTLTNRQAAMLFHWVQHINDPDYAWVPKELKVNMPQYNGGQK